MGLTRLFLAQRGLCFHCRKPMLYSKADGKEGHGKLRFNREHVIPKVKGDYPLFDLPLRGGVGCPYPSEKAWACQIRKLLKWYWCRSRPFSKIHLRLFWSRYCWADLHSA